MAGLFITGTNTEVGKTHVGAMIARALSAAGQRVGVYKPVASGCRNVEGQVVADDAVALWEAAGRPGMLEQVCPQRFGAPLAPHRAAMLEGAEVDADLLRAGYDYWQQNYDPVIVEGAGGLLSPLATDLDNIALAKQLKLPLLVVAANELGTINTTRQTLVTAQTLAPELPVLGVVLNQVAPLEDDASLTTNAEEIAARCDVPLLATVAYQSDGFEPSVDWAKLISGM